MEYETSWSMRYILLYDKINVLLICIPFGKLLKIVFFKYDFLLSARNETDFLIAKKI